MKLTFTLLYKTAVTCTVAWLLLLSSVQAQPKIWGLTKAGGGVDLNYNQGAIFNMDATDGGNFTIAHHFLKDTANPGINYGAEAVHLVPMNGKYYGVTAYGGLRNNAGTYSPNGGVLYEYDPTNNSYNKLYDFDVSTGSVPQGSLTAVDGVLWGMTNEGGKSTSKSGVIYSYNPATGEYTDVYDFDNTTDHGRGTPCTLLYNPANHLLYGNSNGVFFSIDPTVGGSSFTKLAAHSTSNVVLYNNVLYGIDETSIFSFDPATNTYQDIYTLPAGYGGNVLLPSYVGGFGFCVANNLLYSSIQNNNTNIIFSYNPASGVYTEIARAMINDGYNCTGMAMYNNILYASYYTYGKNGGGGLLSIDPATGTLTHLYDCNTRWSEPIASSPTGITIIGNQLYVSFGLGGVGVGNQNDPSGYGAGAIAAYDPAAGTMTPRIIFNLIPSGVITPIANLCSYGNTLYGMASAGGGYSSGGLFSYTPTTGAYQHYDLNANTTGSSPESGVIAYNGKIYGITPYGGTSDDDGGPGGSYGTIFTLDTTTKQFGLEHQFSYASGQGAVPLGPLTQVNNLLYGATYYGGASDYGVIYSYDPVTHTKTVLGSIPNGVDMAEGPDHAFVYMNGKLYGFGYGGANGCGFIFSFDLSTNTYASVYDFAPLNGVNYIPVSIMLYNNMIYGMTSSIMYPNKKGYIFSYDPGANALTDLYDFGMDFPTGKLVPYDGHLVGMTLLGANGQGQVFSFDIASKALTVLHDFTSSDGNTPTGLVLVKGTPMINFKDVTLTYGHADSLLAGTSTNTNVNNKITYTIGDPTIATVVNGTLHILKAGTTTITVAQAEDGGYVAASLQRQLVINKAPLTVSALPDTITYGQPIPTSFTAVYKGFVNGDTTSTALTGVPAFSTPATSASLPGNYDLNVNVSAISANNYAISGTKGTLLIQPAAISIYFGGIPATVTYGDAAFDAGAKANSGADPVYTSHNTAVAAITGDNKIQLTGAGTATLTVTFPATATTEGGSKDTVITVAKKVLTVKVNDAYMSAGGTVPTFTASFNTLANGDDVSVITPAPTFHTDATSSSPVGQYDITITNINALTAANYTIDANYQKGNLVIGSIVFNGTDTRTYGAAAYDPGATSSNGATPTYTSSNTQVAVIVNNQVQIKGIGQTTIKADFPAAGIEPAQSATQLLTVQPAVLTVTAADTSRMYGQINPSFRIIYSGFVNGDNASVLTAQAQASTTATPASQPGGYDITPFNVAAANYTINNVKATLTVTPATQTISFSVLADKTVGAADFSLTATASSGLSVSYTSSNPAVATVTNGVVHILSVGSTAITASQAGNSNYLAAPNQVQSLNVLANTTTITLGAIASKTYGDVDFIIAATSNNTATPIQYTSSNPAVATVTNGVVHIIGAGSTAITATQPATDTYSAGSSQPQILIVAPAQLTVTAYNQTRYVGQNNASFVINYTGFKNGEDQSSLTQLATGSTPADANSPAGTYPINVNGAQSASYSFVYVPGTLTVLGAQPQAISFNTLPLERYGNADFDGGAIATSNLPIVYVSSDSKVATIVNGLIHLTGAGTVTITATQPGGNGFNTAAPVAQTMTVTKGELTIRPDDISISEGQPLPALTLNYSGFVNGDNAANLTTQPIVKTTAANGSPFGQYTITASGAASDNYNITYLPGTLTITAPADKVNAYCSAPDQITVNIYTATPQKATIQLFSLAGQRIVSRDVQLLKSVNGFTLPTGNVAAGIYIIKVWGEKMQYSEKLRIH